MENIEYILGILDKDGKITDKGIAIELLKKSPKVWNLLSEELQNDIEVILYHQPSACVFKYVFSEDPHVGLSFVIDGDILCEPGFYAEYKKNDGRYCEFTHGYITHDVVYPDELVDSTLKEVYKNLQGKLKSKYEYSRKLFDGFASNDNMESSFCDVEYSKKLFDKQDIDMLVQEALQEYAQLLGEEQVRRK